jgi:predicted AlkP superfamily pyrophosphatase or phosphodiesterase
VNNMFRKFALSIITLFYLSSGLSQQKKIPEKPKLVVQVVVEQMRYELLQRYWDRFSDKGFKKLVNEGAFCKDACYDYLVTESAPGYATIATGSNPSEHGIVSNNWYIRLRNATQFCVDDPKLDNRYSVFDENKYSPKQIIGSTFGDELRASNFKRSKVISISIKNYASVLSGGYLANAAYWMDENTADWVSSVYYMDSLPRWVRDFNKKALVPLYLSREWNTLNPIGSYQQSLADNNSYETGFSNHQRTFPYNLKQLSSTEGSKVIKYTPYGNSYTASLAVAAIIFEELGKDSYPDLLTISFATTGYVTDLFGVRSVELEDVYLRLDKEISHLLNVLDDRVGKENVIVVLTSDRGVSDHPDFNKEIGMPAGEFDPQKAVFLLNSYLKAIYGRTGWVKHYSNKQIYLDQLLIDASKLSLADVQLKAAQFMSEFNGVANATTGSVLQTNSFLEGTMRKFMNNYSIVRSGDVLLSLKPGWVEKKQYSSKNSIQQSSPYRYDSHVPLIFYGWKIKHTEILESVHMNDIAPTLSDFLKITYPSGASGKLIKGLIESD